MITPQTLSRREPDSATDAGRASDCTARFSPAVLSVGIALLKVLDAMLAEPCQDHYGFELIKSTGLQSGTLYPLLIRLESAGWLESGWETEHIAGRPRRRYYRLTGLGVDAARRTFAEVPQPAPRAPRPRLRPSFGAIS